MEIEWKDELQKIQDDWTERDGEPLDGDEVDDLVELLRAKLNYMNGNITEQEYLEEGNSEQATSNAEKS